VTLRKALNGGGRDGAPGTKSARERDLWEIAGRPSGRNDEFWFRAERELTEEEAG
jgi:hypothetical protein